MIKKCEILLTVCCAFYIFLVVHFRPIFYEREDSERNGQRNDRCESDDDDDGDEDDSFATYLSSRAIRTFSKNTELPKFAWNNNEKKIRDLTTYEIFRL